MRQLLLCGGYAAGGFALYYVCNSLGQSGVEFVSLFSVAYDIDGYFGVDKSEDFQINVYFVVYFDYVFFPPLIAGSVFDYGHLTVCLLYTSRCV